MSDCNNNSQESQLNLSFDFELELVLKSPSELEAITDDAPVLLDEFLFHPPQLKEGDNKKNTVMNKTFNGNFGPERRKLVF